MGDKDPPTLEVCLDKRTHARRRYTKTETTVRKHYDAAMGFNAVEPRDEEQFELEVRASIKAQAQLKEMYSDLQDVQDEIDYHTDNDARIEGMSGDAQAKEEAVENRYKDAYIMMDAKIQRLEGIWHGPADKAPSKKSGSSKDTFSPDTFTKCLASAFKDMNTGITGDQLTEILATITRRKRDLKIPKFKGDPLMFDQWRNLLEGEISKPGYTETEKAHFAISLLEGECREMVAALKDPTYENVLEVLENKYGDSLARINKAVVDIANMEAVTGTGAKELEGIYGKLLSNWNYLTKKTDGYCDLTENSWIFTALVCPKLPRVLIRKWDGEQMKETKRTRYVKKSPLPISFDQLLENLKEALQVARRTETTSTTKKESSSFSSSKSHAKSHSQPSKPSGYALSVNEVKKTSQGCIFCGKDHPSFRCTAAAGMSTDDRFKKVKGRGACFNCLSTTHAVKDCKSRSCSKCSKRHHSLLHWESKRQNADSGAKEDPPPEASGSSGSKDVVKAGVGLVKALQGPHSVLMQSAMAKIESKSAVSKARVLFDSGSGVSFISRRKSKEMQLKGKEMDADFTLAGGSCMKLKTERVQFRLSSLIPNWKGETFEIVAYVIDKPSAPLQEVDVDLTNLPHLQGLQLADNYPRKEPEEIDVMLGIEDTLHILLPDQVTGPRGMPIGQKSHFGWILSGTYSDGKSNNRPMINTVHVCSIQVKTDEADIATKHWALEHMGILPNESKDQLTDLEKEALTQHKEKTTVVNGQFETGLIKHPRWKARCLKPNYQQARRRLEGLEHRLQKDPDLCKSYKEQIKELIEKGRAEKVVVEPTYGKEDGNCQIWYLPHHPVIRNDKVTTKVRVVFDGSAKGKEGVSLNETLLPGPALQPDLQGVLLRFRRHRVAIIADIEKMFLQIRMNEGDRDSQRFLWRDMETDREPDVYRLTTVTFELSCSPFSSIQCIRDLASEIEDRFPKAASELKENMFV
ncbi:uncharacterized protein LOC135498364 [Lineus longissimus]|uniref:uncharacterized protein LOC135498364 n=1 Tax=Lineus longissimus TaxID=88925 RepID=UPI00315C811C